MEELSIHEAVYHVPWKDSWAVSFQKEKERILTALDAASHAADIYHVGSTSIVGMYSKPIIDILVCPGKDIPVEEVIPDLEQIGYLNLGDGGRQDRYFLSFGDKPNETFYVHLCHEDNQVAQDQLLFQKIERENETVRKKYARLKVLLSDVLPDDRVMYREIKGLFIEGVLSAYRQAVDE